MKAKKKTNPHTTKTNRPAIFSTQNTPHQHWNETSHFGHLHHTYYQFMIIGITFKIKKKYSFHLINNHSFLYQIHTWDTFTKNQNPLAFIQNHLHKIVDLCMQVIPKKHITESYHH
jgi:hypothetical protein